MSIKSKKIREAAKGQQCTFNIAGVCNYNPETVVFCHLPSETGGMALKSSDLCGAFGCSACHDVVDGRVYNFDYKDDGWFYNFRANNRTIQKLFEMGVISIEGVK